MEKTIKIFDKLSIFNNNKTIIYGQFIRYKVKLVEIKGIASFEFIQSEVNNDFIIKIDGKHKDLILLFTQLSRAKISEIKINLEYPFENHLLNLNPNYSSIITTICKDYSHRLEEWIQYNLKLGFSGIIVFDNTANKSNKLNESLKNCDNSKSMKEICDKYKDNVLLVSCPYSPFGGEHWNNIQRITLHIGVNAFKNQCKFIALIDADEFIYIPKNPKIKIGDYLNLYNTTITLQSNILTNKNKDDNIDNNILKIAKYIGEDKYTKTILKTDLLKDDEFINTPHNHYTEKILAKDEIIHYHCWINERYKFKENMQFFDSLEKFMLD